MSLREKFSEFHRYPADWRRLMVQGGTILLAGALLALASLLNPDVSILHARGHSLLPVSAFILLGMGLLEFLDAFLAKELRDFIHNLQVGALDTVVAGVIILGISEEPERLSLLITAFLLTRGIVRITLAYSMQLPLAVSTAAGGATSILLGLLIWLEWPSSAGWFLAFCLNVEIGLRGWAMMMFALWIQARKPGEAVNG
jgi:uncharacterized membrane protein HdeD (DUF308 family)